MILALLNKRHNFLDNWVKKCIKGLRDWRPAVIFSRNSNQLIPKVLYFCTPQKAIVENNLNISQKLQMTDILMENAELSVFVIKMDEETTQFLKDTEEKQDKVLKCKEVNEELLRMVVQL